MSKTPKSVMIRLTTPLPVKGSEQCFKILGLPSLAVCSIRITIFCTPATKSIAPPMPLTFFPGIIQLAKSPRSETSIAPKIARLICPPRIMAKDSELEKNEAPERAVTVCLPALIKSASTVCSVGNSPIPNKPFSDCSQIFILSGI